SSASCAVMPFEFQFGRLKTLKFSYLYLSCVLTEVAESSRLPDKMKVVFDRARSEEKHFAKLMHDLCFSFRISLSKKRRLVAELDVMVERGDAEKPLEHIREIVARDSVFLGDLEKLLARALVGVSLKDGYVANIGEKE
ncbi:hypothetical protein Tco_1322120, partial [Tanacetum coccineum]